MTVYYRGIRISTSKTTTGERAYYYYYHHLLLLLPHRQLLSEPFNTEKVRLWDKEEGPGETRALGSKYRVKLQLCYFRKYLSIREVICQGPEEGSNKKIRLYKKWGLLGTKVVYGFWPKRNLLFRGWR